MSDYKLHIFELPYKTSGYFVVFQWDSVLSLYV